MTGFVSFLIARALISSLELSFPILSVSLSMSLSVSLCLSLYGKYIELTITKT